MPTLDTGCSTLHSIELDGVRSAYIARNSSLESLLFDRNLIGLDFSRLCLSSNAAIFRHFQEEFGDVTDVAELMLLGKGYEYRLGDALEVALRNRPQTNFVATTRSAVHGEIVEVEIQYSSLEAPQPTLVIGDTVASGSTICAALEHYLHKHRVERVLLICLAGSGVGASRIGHFCRSRGIDLTIVFGLAVFGLATNGFDLSFLHPETRCAPEYRPLAEQIFAGRPISAVGWDFGSQAQAIDKYRALCWIEARYWGLEDSELFALARQPSYAYQIEREYPAFKDRFPDIQQLLLAS